MTKKLGRSADNDPSLAPILNANTKAVCIVGAKGRSGKSNSKCGMAKSVWWPVGDGYGCRR